MYLQQDICDVLGTISPDEKTVKKYEGLSKSTEDAKTFLSLLKSPLFFKSVVCVESPNYGFAKDMFDLLKNGAIKDEWMEFKEAYLSQISNSFTNLPPSVIKDYISFEMELAENLIDAYPNDDDFLEDAKPQRFELEEQVVKYLEELLENDEVYRYDQTIRGLLETVVILNSSILEDPFFESLFQRQQAVLMALLSGE